MKRVVLATFNEHKASEVQAIFADLGVEVEVVSAASLGLSAPVEDGVTFEANALLKARAAFAECGLPVLADDSGICVDVLGGAPGVFSARWSGGAGVAENTDLLLRQLADVPPAHRGAQFVAVVALVAPSADGQPVEQVVRGEIAGNLTYERRGEAGFGYDPVFVPIGYEVTTAELSAQEKNRISHRRRALEAIAPFLKALA